MEPFTLQQSWNLQCFVPQLLPSCICPFFRACISWRDPLASFPDVNPILDFAYAKHALSTVTRKKKGGTTLFYMEFLYQKMILKSSLSEKIWHMSPVLSALLGIFVSVSLTRLFSNFVIWKTATEHIVTTILQIRLEQTYQIQEQEGLSSVPSGKLGLRESSTSNLTRVKMQQPLPLYKMTSEELFFSHCTHVHAPFPSPHMCNFKCLSLLPNTSLLSSWYQFSKDWRLTLTKPSLLY